MSKTRDFHGYMQYHDGDCWVFVVSGFDGTLTGVAGFCTVIRSDDTYERVPIDAKDRILIHGKRYGRRYWNH